MNSKLLALAVVVMGSSGMRAAQRIHVDEIPSRIAPIGTLVRCFGVKVTTVEGVRHSSGAFRLEQNRIGLIDDGFLYAGGLSWIPFDDIARIEIRRGRRTVDFTLDSLGLGLLVAAWCIPGGSADACWIAPFAVPGAIAVAAVTAPVTFVADGIQLLIPPKVYEIIH